jgi:predicted secreted protein
MKFPTKRALSRNAWLGALWLPLAAAAQVPLPAPVPVQNQLSLSATASVEVSHDVLGIVFSTTREGAQAGAVQAELTRALNEALAEARKIAKPGQVDVSTGNFSLYPRHAPKGGSILSWQGTAELRVEGRDTEAIAKLAGRIQSMSVARVGFSLSREAREKVEGDVAAEAIARFRAKAEAYARQFGFGTVSLREVQVMTNEPPNQPMPMMRASRASAMGGDEALPVEAGKANVTASVNGSVQMK